MIHGVSSDKIEIVNNAVNTSLIDKLMNINKMKENL